MMRKYEKVVKWGEREANRVQMDRGKVLRANYKKPLFQDPPVP